MHADVKGSYHYELRNVLSMKESTALIPPRMDKMLPRCLTDSTIVRLFLCLLFITGNAAAGEPADHTRVRALAATMPWNIARTTTDADHPLGVQTLSVEKLESKSDPHTTKLKVYQFNYFLLQARVLTIDEQSSQILDTRSINSVHLPLNDVEISFAQALLQRHDPILNTLRNEQTRRGRIAFSAISELDVKASIYEPLDSSHVCHQQRCALLSLFDDTRTVFAIEPIVNLQTLQVNLLENQ